MTRSHQGLGVEFGGWCFEGLVIVAMIPLGEDENCFIASDTQLAFKLGHLNFN